MIYDTDKSTACMEVTLKVILYCKNEVVTEKDFVLEFFLVRF